MKILLAADDSDASRQAEWFLTRMPFPEPIDLLIANVALVPSMVHLKHEFPASVNEMLESYHAKAEALLLGESLRFEGINGTVETVQRSGHTAHELVTLAEERMSDLIVMGARGLSPAKRFLLGSVSQNVAKHAPCSVLVTRRSPALASSDESLRILCCLDGSKTSRQAVQTLARFHWGDQVHISLLSVVTTLKEYGEKVYQRTRPMRDEQRRHAKEDHNWASKSLLKSTSHVTSDIREAVSVSNEIVEVIEHNHSDLVVMGHRGMSRIERFFLGSTSESVLRHAPCSVWIVRDSDVSQ